MNNLAVNVLGYDDGTEDCKEGDRKCNKGKNRKERSSDAGTFTETVNSSVMNVSNYPNPAMTQTTIIFELKENAKKVNTA